MPTLKNIQHLTNDSLSWGCFVISVGSKSPPYTEEYQLPEVSIPMCLSNNLCPRWKIYNTWQTIRYLGVVLWSAWAQRAHPTL